MSQDVEKYLQNTLQMLEKAYEKHQQTQTYNQDSEKLKILIEMVKEQQSHENTGLTAR